MDELNLLQRLVILVPPILLAVTLHEVAHGWAALTLGDTTARASGRLSLNPLRHVDPVGTVLVPGLLFLLGGFIFGWARPVPVDYRRLRRPKRDMALVALAGPAANLAMALAWGLAAAAGLALLAALPWAGMPLLLMGSAGVTVNIIIGVLNLLPIPPLDGSRVLTGLLPDGFGAALARLEPFGLVLLLLLLVSGWLAVILEPPVAFLQNLVYSVVS
ncbi:MAG: site-2 protease family protein [Pseudomonadota bacterium]|nr:site-2 protease family protein [Pseudomonadota bacterium]